MTAPAPWPSSSSQRSSSPQCFLPTEAQHPKLPKPGGWAFGTLLPGQRSFAVRPFRTFVLTISFWESSQVPAPQCTRCLQGPLVCTSQTNFPQLWTSELKRGFQRSVNVSAGSISTNIAEPFTYRGNQSSVQICAKDCKQIATSASLSVSGAEI